MHVQTHIKFNNVVDNMNSSFFFSFFVDHVRHSISTQYTICCSYYPPPWFINYVPHLMLRLLATVF